MNPHIGSKEHRSSPKMGKVSGDSLFSFPGVAFIYAIFTLIATWPLVLAFGRLFPGDPEADAWKHIWGEWWFKYSILERHEFPLKTSLLNWPAQGSIYHIDPLNALLSIPLQWFFSPAESYTILIFVQILSGAVGAYLLASYLTGSRAAGIPAGVIYGFCPYLLAHGVASGVAEVTNTVWIPLTLLFFFKTWQEKGMRNPVLAGIFLFLASFSCWYYGLFSVLLVLLLLLFLFLLAKGKIYKQHCMMPGTPGGLPAMRLLLSFLIFVLLVVPCALVFQRIARSQDSLIDRANIERSGLGLEHLYLTSTDPRHFGQRIANVDSCSLLEYILPGKRNLDYKYEIDKIYRVCYAGFLVLALSLLAVPWLGRVPWVGFWLGCAIFFLLLSLGPFLQISPTVYFDRVTPLYALMFTVFPFFKQVRTISRLNLVVMLSFSILCAFGFLRIFKNRKRSCRALGGIATAVLILAEFLLFSPLPFPLPMSPAHIPDFYHALAKEEGESGIIDLPVVRMTGNLRPGEYYYYQTVHQKGIPYRVDGLLSESLMENNLFLSLTETQGAFESHGFLLQQGLEALKEKKFKYIIVHTGIIHEEKLATMREILSSVVGKPAIWPDGIEVYRIY